MFSSVIWRSLAVALAMFCLFLAFGCRTASESAVEVASAGDPLPNLRRAVAGVWSGGAPAGGEAFRRLRAMGVSMVVSVDGARPDVIGARSEGLRYVHIPIGYDGIPEAARRQLARVALEADGTVYIHCHHGRHRAPAAAAIVCMAGKAMSRSQAIDYLADAGTSRDYVGLWRDVKGFRQPLAQELLPELVPVAEVDSLTAAMAGLDRAWDRLNSLRRNGWKPLAGHPDITAAREALLLEEGFRESVRALGADGEPSLRSGLNQAEASARALGRALGDGRLEQAAALGDELKRSCAACHQRQRN